jgi:hypothetical protein
MVYEKEEKLREAFAKIKKDMDFLRQEINNIKQDLGDLIHLITRSTHPQQFDTQNGKIKGIKPYKAISTGNDGVPADSQQTFDTSEIPEIEEKPLQKEQETKETTPETPQTSEAPQRLSLRQLKKVVDNFTEDLKIKFKSLSKQEFFVFSLVYNLDIQGQKPDYKTIAIKAGLTESSVRDYISRLIHKGIPLKKEKINNKSIVILVPDELKSLATLDNLTRLKQYNQDNNPL